MIRELKKSDAPEILRITASSGFFSQEEIECVRELLEEVNQSGTEQSGYYFLVLEEDMIEGYACFGPRALTDGTYDLYWIAVDAEIHRKGAGKQLMAACENAITCLGGRLVIVETSGTEKYAPTRAFYLGIGYTQEAVIKDFYSPGDDLVIFTKTLQQD